MTYLLGTSLLLKADRIFDIKLIDENDFLELIFRYGFNILFAFIAIRLVYFRRSGQKQYLFTLALFNTATFFICHLMGNVKLGLEFAFGLFALFSILRFRSDTIPLREMTYLFIAIAIAMINALTTKKVSYAELVFTNAAMVGVAYLLEFVWLGKRESISYILYEKIDLIKPENYAEMLEDLRTRTGLNISKAEVDRVNFLRDVARIKIYYHDTPNQQTGATE
jgi:hypothetical protein